MCCCQIFSAGHCEMYNNNILYNNDNHRAFNSPKIQEMTAVETSQSSSTTDKTGY